MFSAHNDQGSLKHELPEKVCKFLTQKMFSPTYSRYVPPVPRAPASKLVLQRGGLLSGLEGNLESRIVYRGVGANAVKFVSNVLNEFISYTYFFLETAVFLKQYGNRKSRARKKIPGRFALYN